MVSGVCFLQEGQAPAQVMAALGKGIDEIVASMGLGRCADIDWILVPEGYGWTAGAPSTTSVVSLSTPAMTQAQREGFLEAVCALWVSRTGCDVSEILATAIPAA